ncbi:MAG: hypothetical protein JSW67_11595 [Candidatus Latescibacterota bacterium]|nr:MAG: hypothetical protein JSW67_11595 [Candidatus Latescibacterota bacterium]
MHNRSAARSWDALGRLLAVVALVSLVWTGCSQILEDPPTAPGANEQTTQKADPTQLLGSQNPRIQHVMAVQDRHTPQLMGIDRVVGTATSVDEEGTPVIKVYTAEQLAPGRVPRELDGVRVVQQVSGRLVAKKGPPPMDGGGGGDDPRAKQTPPVKMGTSGGWRYDLANGYCCGGTLGSLIQIGGTKYVLSNYHVLYADIVSGGNNRTAQAGDPVIQPGLIDVGCNASNAQNVATLVNNGGSLPNSNIDAGIAQVIPGMVDESGAILSIGTISSSTVGASVGQKVKKMGRTTGLGRGTVDGLNATVSIGYENECAGGSAFTKTFTGQIIITNNRCRFLDGGDSGSLMVEDVDTNPRAVGLLYAGSVRCIKTAVAVANPIGDVLSRYNATMVGN